jgi:hypothetical protein
MIIGLLHLRLSGLLCLVPVSEGSSQSDVNMLPRTTISQPGHKNDAKISTLPWSPASVSFLLNSLFEAALFLEDSYN